MPWNNKCKLPETVEPVDESVLYLKNSGAMMGARRQSVSEFNVTTNNFQVPVPQCLSEDNLREAAEWLIMLADNLRDTKV